MQADNLSLFLFLPANRLERLEKAVSSSADAVILDLEDAVALEQKDEARENLHGALDRAAAVKPIILRINATDTEWHAKDVEVARRLPLEAIMLPKAETALMCEGVRNRAVKPVLALIETARGIQNANEVAKSANRLAFGNLDFAADIGVQQDRLALAHARSILVLASRNAGIAPPVDGVTQEFNDSVVIEDDARHGRSMGFGGKLLIHPKQIEPARRAFRPAPDEVEWARRVLEVAGSHTGVLTLDGRMVDAPVLARARQILSRSR